LREYWTNFYAGNLATVVGPRPFESALSARSFQITVSGQGNLPGPRAVTLDEQIAANRNFQWVKVEGVPTFISTEGNNLILELNDGKAVAQVHVSDWKGPLPRDAYNSVVRVQGVCEATYGTNRLFTPSFIWVTGDEHIVFEKKVETNQDSSF